MRLFHIYSFKRAQRKGNILIWIAGRQSHPAESLEREDHVVAAPSICLANVEKCLSNMV